jgi:hypothetical protein
MDARHVAALVAFGGFVVTACSGASREDALSGEQGVDDDRSHRDAGRSDSGDGPPTRHACTTQFGDGLRGAYGRIDGFVVAVLAPRSGLCNADSHHVHIQVTAAGATYDVAVNTDAGFIAHRDVRLPGAAWSEGWHSNASLDYVRDLGLHSGDFTAENQTQTDQDVEAVLASANHISIFATPYNHSGVHLVHRQGQGHDGAVITDPLSPTAHLLAFHFSDQRF